MPTTSPARVDERTARVARRDRGVGLDETVERAVLGDHGAVECRHDAQRDRRLTVEVEREADRHHFVADADRAGIGEARRPGNPIPAIRRSARSLPTSMATSLASRGSVSPASRTRIFDASATTWALVTISPSDVVMIPVPIDSPASSPSPTSALIVTTDGPTAADDRGDVDPRERRRGVSRRRSPGSMAPLAAPACGRRAACRSARPPRPPRTRPSPSPRPRPPRVAISSPGDAAPADGSGRRWWQRTAAARARDRRSPDRPRRARAGWLRAPAAAASSSAPRPTARARSPRSV